MDEKAPFENQPAPFCINSSPKVGALFAALARAQGKFKAIPKNKVAKVRGRSRSDGTAVEYSYRYADLADMLSAVTPALAEEGLALVQPVRLSRELAQITTILVHGESEQWVSEVYDIATYPSPQEQGSAITYGRRYSVGCILGISPDADDDGQAAQDASTKTTRKEQKPKDAPTTTEELVTPEEAKAVRDGIKGLFSTLKGDELAQACRQFLSGALPGVEKTSDIPKSKFKEITDAIEAERKSRDEAAKPVDNSASGGGREPGSDG